MKYRIDSVLFLYFERNTIEYWLPDNSRIPILRSLKVISDLNYPIFRYLDLKDTLRILKSIWVEFCSNVDHIENMEKFAFTKWVINSRNSDLKLCFIQNLVRRHSSKYILSHQTLKSSCMVRLCFSLEMMMPFKF